MKTFLDAENGIVSFPLLFLLNDLVMVV